MPIAVRQGGPVLSTESGSGSGIPSTSSHISSSPRTTSRTPSNSTATSRTETADAAAISAISSSTSNTPFFPSPTTTVGENNRTLQSTKNTVEGALIVAAVALLSASILWRIVCLRRGNRALRGFCSCNPEPDAPPRPRTVPRTTGLPPGSASPAQALCDEPMPVFLNGEYQRRRRGGRPRAGDIDAGGRRGAIAHPDDPDEYLPVYDDKDVLPRYQDLHRTDEGTSPNGSGRMSDTIPLVTRMNVAPDATLQTAHEPPSSSDVSHDGHGLGVLSRHPANPSNW